MPKPIDTTNKYFVSYGHKQDRVTILGTPKILTTEEALVLAAWLVAMAEGPETHSFQEVLEAVKNS
jgi:hypothetical protein